MIPRYSTPEMQKIWSDENKFKLWFQVEIAALKSLEKYKIVPEGTACELEKKITKIDPRRISQIEEITKHDVVAFLTHLEEIAGSRSRFVHFGMTSSDVLDTAFAIQLKDATDIIINEAEKLAHSLKEKSLSYKDIPVAGRTHGIHAKPTTLGLVFALWYAEVLRGLERMQYAKNEIAVGKLSGPVGTYCHFPPAVEEYAMKILGLKPETISNQIVQRDRHAFYFCVLAVLGATIEKMALNIRHWQRTEVSEAFEPFGKGQKGSSAMPHKRNPVAAENLCGLARLLRSYTISAIENVALWHERDISHSSVERIIAPDATTLLHYMIRRMEWIISGIEINIDKIKENLGKTEGLIFSEDIMTELILAGMSRQKAHTLVQKNAMEAIKGNKKFLELLLSDSEIVQTIGKEKIQNAFDVRRSLKHIDKIIRRVLRNGNRKNKRANSNHNK